MGRPLNPDEKALWARVVETVRPLRPVPTDEIAPVGPATLPPPKPVKTPTPRLARSTATPPSPSPGDTLDASWDRRLARGLAQPDLMVDLHGHRLASAYDLLDMKLEQAIGSGARLMLLVTGKPPQGEPPVARGRIRAAVHDWLAASRHASDIAAVRGAHPRHGGAGALYIVIRRRRTSPR